MAGTARTRPPDEAIRVLVQGVETGGRLAVVELRERRGGGPPRHRHTREDEVVYVLAGRVTFDLNGATVDARAGDCLLLRRGGEHSYRVRSAAARLLVIATPGAIEGFYRELGQAAADRGAGVIERLIVVAARHGVTITGPNRCGGRSPPRQART